jgi:hypothetical protein
MKACACSDSRSWAFIRDDLDAPDRVAPDVPAVDANGQAPMAYPEGGPTPQSLPYPALPEVVPVPGQTPAPVQPGQPGQATPAPTPAPGTRTPPARKAPEARQQDDTTFF